MSEDPSRTSQSSAFSHALADDVSYKEVAKTYVWHKAQCFFVSTIERESSAMEGPRRFNETLVWLYDWDKRERGEWIYQDEACRGSLATHQRIVQALYDTGQPSKESTADE